MPKLRTLKLLCCAAVLGLAGCDSIGDGTAPEKLRLLPAGGSDFQTDVPSTTAFECIRGGLQLIVEFSDGRLGDFTTRGVYSSSNDAILKVSNGDIPFPGAEGQFLNFGTIVPQAPGTATITARYLDFQTSIEVVVRSATDFQLGPATVQNIAPLSQQQFFVTAVLDGRNTDITSAATWSFVTPDTTVATIGVGTGTVAALKLGGPLTVQAAFPACGKTFTGPVSVSPLKSVSLQHQAGFSGDLIKNTSEALTVIGAFREDPANPGQDLPEQDLSTQVTLAVPTVDPVIATVLRPFVSAAAVGTTSVTASFDTDRDNEPPSGGGADPGLVESNALPINVVDATLESITISPANPTILSLTRQQFNAIGNYSGGRTQDITRHVTWTSDDADEDKAYLDTIPSGTLATAGIALSRLNEDKVVAIKAQVGSESSPPIISATTNLTITAVPLP